MRRLLRWLFGDRRDEPAYDATAEGVCVFPLLRALDRREPFAPGSPQRVELPKCSKCRAAYIPTHGCDVGTCTSCRRRALNLGAPRWGESEVAKLRVFAIRKATGGQP